MIYSIEEFGRFKDECPVLEDLNIYLIDIITSIEEEISSSISKHFGQNENWRTRKNPNFMLKFSAKDKIFLDINQNLNKITNMNWKTISTVLTELLNKHFAAISEDIRSQTEISLAATLVSNIMEKSLVQDIFAEYYIKTLIGIDIATMKPLINVQIQSLINQFNELMEKDEPENNLQQMVGLNIGQYKNIGCFFGGLYNEAIMSQPDLLRLLPKFIRKIADSLEWVPINKVVVESKINLLVGFFISTMKIIWTSVDKDTQQDLECQLNILTNHCNLPQRLKYHLLDVSDKILDIKKLKVRAQASTSKASSYSAASAAASASASGSSSHHKPHHHHHHHNHHHNHQQHNQRSRDQRDSREVLDSDRFLRQDRRRRGGGNN
jgi:hypothetical protein